MHVNFFEVFDRPDACRKKHFEQLGYVAALMGRSKSHRDHPQSHLVKIIFPAILQGNIKLFFNFDGEIVGYVAWAYLAEDVERRIHAERAFRLHPSEWNEGERLWILDFLVPFGSLRYVIRNLKKGIFSTAANVAYWRTNAAGKKLRTFKSARPSGDPAATGATPLRPIDPLF